MNKRAQEYISRIETSKSLPTLPHILVKLISACQNDHISVADLSKIIHADVSLAAKVLKLANSAYFTTAGKISRIDHAVTRLGRDAVKNLAVSSAIQQVFRKTAPLTDGFDLTHFWRHSLTVAVLARTIAAKSGYHQPEQAFLAGMIHDIGRLILASNFPYEYKDVLHNKDHESESLIDREIRMMVSHTEIGVWLLKKWRMDSLTMDAVLYHHEPPSRISQSFPLVKIIYAANDMAQKTGSVDGAFNVLKSLFTGVSPDVEEMLLKADEEVQEWADFLGFSIGPKTLQTAEHQLGELQTPELVSEVKNFSLMTGVLQNLIACAGEDAILRVIQHGFHLLFDVQKVIFFLIDLEDGLLKAQEVKSAKETDFPQGLIMNVLYSDSLIAQSIQRNVLLSSFHSSGTSRPAILDEQILHLLESEGIMSIPLTHSGEKIGAMVIGLEASDEPSLLRQEKLLTLFSAQASAALYINRFHALQTKKITTERLSAMTDFARKVVHETNNPLGIIKNYLRILSTCLDKASPAQQDLHIIGEEIDRISRILKRLSDFSKAGAVHKTVLDLNAVLGDMIRVLHQSFPESYQIKIHEDLKPTVPMIYSDRDALKQIFINLMKNAVEALNGRGNIYVATDFMPGITDIAGKQVPFYGKDQVKIVISDDGPGIPPDVSERLFEPYVSTKGEKHSGIGLSVVYNMIKELGGSITYGNAAGRGASFTILLPVEPS
jgi:HD-like signal output (HDOD) protein/signal transduction histidine kinase